MVDRYIPLEITAGLSFTATISESKYPAPEWELAFYIRGPETATITAEVDGTSHKITASAATTGAWPAGQYWYAIRVTDGTDVFEIEKGTLQVLADLAAVTADGYDGRTQAEIALEAIDAVIANRATVDQERYRINNRELYRTPISQLLQLRSFYAAKVRKERGLNSGGFGRSIPVRFS